MKLYAWQPKGHGELSFFVIAENEEAALMAVNDHIKRGKVVRWFDEGEFAGHRISDYDVGGWGTDYYRLTVAEVGQVLTNDNS